MTPFFSIVMPSYLGKYPGAASNREPKLMRAINSILAQTDMSWELLIVADGCERTVELVKENYGASQRIKTILIEKQELWHPSVRNIGIHKAKGEWVLYLDIDDYWGPGHLATIRHGLQGILTGWAWFNDLTWDKQRGEFIERTCDITHKDQHGTSNLVHRRSLEVYWREGSYKQDAHFATELKKTGPGVKIPTPEYCVAHIPGRFDV